MLSKKGSDPNTPRSVDSQYMNVSQSTVMPASYSTTNPMADDPFAAAYDAIVACRDTIDTGKAIDIVFELNQQLNLLKNSTNADPAATAADMKQSIAALSALNPTVGEAARTALLHGIAVLSPEANATVSGVFDSP